MFGYTLVISYKTVVFGLGVFSAWVFFGGDCETCDTALS